MISIHKNVINSYTGGVKSPLSNIITYDYYHFPCGIRHTKPVPQGIFIYI